MNDELGPCEVECGKCRGRGYITWHAITYEGTTTGPLALQDCPHCNGTGKITVHEWKRLGATSKGKGLCECAKCGETEACE